MSEKLHRVIALIDAANQEDPSQESDGQRSYPKAYLYSLRMSQVLDRFQPDASEALKIAVRAQHIRRWEIPRTNYPAGRIGYLKWRKNLGHFHAEETARLMLQVDYGPEIIEDVQHLLTKQNLRQNPATQTLEDVACLVFIQFYLEDFATRQEHDKLLDIIRKTWKKMSRTGREAALALDLPSAVKALIGEALN